MNTSELELPKHLYTESTDPGGTGTMVTFATDKLIAWSEDGYGDAIDRWCKQICDRKLAAIDRWEENRFLQLEEKWVAVENDGDEHGETEEERYHRACDAVTREADLKRDKTRNRMIEHKAAIEELVRQSRDYVASHPPPPQESHLVEYLVSIVVFAAIAYVLIS